MVVDKLKKIKYSKEEKRFITWLRIVNANSYEEIECYAKAMLARDYSLEEISIITKLSEEEVLKLKK